MPQGKKYYARDARGIAKTQKSLKQKGTYVSNIHSRNWVEWEGKF